MAEPTAMADPRALQALRRIERACARIEAATARPRPASAPLAELERLREAHERLRQRVSGAVEQIDELLAAGNGA
ncbi:hypothetical protein [Sphingosinicella sp. CPCC 101087]|uniref:hypothetical protein n=1 Tax=Sphingosinicella sp. CPCC 101087 TaxID=2497754 RepID=UPI00101B9F1A|nr:hypothetical protein [Sphingosinicella sp. CPCC 101087]